MDRRTGALGVAALGVVVMSAVLWPRAEAPRDAVSARGTVSSVSDRDGPREALAQPRLRTGDEQGHHVRDSSRPERMAVRSSDDLTEVRAAGGSPRLGERVAALEEEEERDREAHEERLRGNIESLQAAADVAVGEGRHAQAELILTRAQHLEARLLAAD